MRVDGNSSAHHSHGSHHAKKSSGAAGGFFSSLDEADQSSTSTGTAANEAIDFSSMTPDDMGDLSDDLFSSGAIDLTQSFKMKTAGMSFGTRGADGSLQPLSDADKDAAGSTPTNFIDTVQGILDNIEAKGQAGNPTSGYQSWQSVLSLMNSMQGGSAEGDAA